MRKEQARHKKREHLARGHHDREDDRAEFFDGVEDEQLASCRCDRQHSHMAEGAVISQNERQRSEHFSRLEQCGSSHENRPDIHAKHHLKLVDRVLFEHFALPLRRERVAEQVQREQPCAVVSVHPRIDLGGLLGEGEQCNSAGDGQRLHILDQRIGFLVQQDAGLNEPMCNKKCIEVINKSRNQIKSNK